MSKILKKYVPFLLGIAIAIGILIGGKLNYSDKSDRLFTSNSKKDKLNRLIDYIDYEYVDEVNTDSIVDVTVNRILDNLDPHSVYIPKEDMQRVTESMKGDFVGIGVSFYNYKDSVAVIQAMPGGPSQTIGIQAGDRILFANGDSLFGKNLSNKQIIAKLKGPLNSLVNLKVYRKGLPKLLSFQVKRNHVSIPSIDANYMLNNTIGYVKINRFAESTYSEFKKATAQLQKKGAKQLVLDLRDNPGGFLSVAEQIADEFLENNKLILFTKNKKGKVEKSFATKKGNFEKTPVYVLINENSASASEIVAGALQDNDKGTIIGRRTFGKGLVQREMQLGDGSAVRLTVSRYYTPTGRSIQRSYKNGNKDYYNAYFSRIKTGELTDSLQIKVADSLQYKTPKGKIVYGGGGIIPDVFVPINKYRQDEVVKYLLETGFINFFVFDQLDKHRDAYEAMQEQDFINLFVITDDVIDDFQQFIKQQFNRSYTFNTNKQSIKLYIKAALGEQLYGLNAYHQILNANDAMLKKVKELAQ